MQAEKAELAEATGQRTLAVTSMGQAVTLLRQVGSERWVMAAEQRLAQLEGKVSLGTALKLW